MKNVKRFCVAIAMITVTAAGFWFFFGEKIKILYKSLNSFKDDNLAYTFQHTKEIQPVKKIQKGEHTFEFLKEDQISLPEEFSF